MGIEKEVYAGYIEIDVDFDSDEWLQYMDECGVSLYDVLEYCGAEIIDAGLREYLCIDVPNSYVDRECLKVLVRIVNEATKRIDAEEVKKRRALSAESRC